MRNIWFPKGAAEYMTKKRFTEMGITEAAIGVRDRTFGTQMAIEEEQKVQKAQKAQKAADENKRKAPVALPLPVSDSSATDRPGFAARYSFWRDSFCWI